MSIETAPATGGLGQVLGYYPLAFRKYATFSGRATRAEFWYFMLFHAVIYLVLGMLLATVDQNVFGIALGVYLLVALVPILALNARRLHDAGFSGWLQLLGFIPFGSILVLIFAAMPAKDPSKYGPNPRVTA